jgi:hypothetical protein
MNATRVKIQKEIDLLKTFIDHPRTGETERDAASRMSTCGTRLFIVSIQKRLRPLRSSATMLG